MRYLLGLCLSIFFVWSPPAIAQLEVIISGGFSGPYKQMLPGFEQNTGIKVINKSGASQGSGPKSIKSQLNAGTTADVVILSREGLAELIAQNRILPKSDVDLAKAPLGLAIPSGSPRPDISTTQAFSNALVKAKKIVMPGSTSGIYLNTELFPRLGISNQIEVQVTERGSESAAILAAHKANIAIQPSSELVNIPGIDYVGALPSDIQLIQTFSAAIILNSPNQEAAKKLIEYLSSQSAATAIKNSGMDLVR